MNANYNPVLNGGSGGLANGPQKIVVGAQGLKAPSFRREQDQILKRILVVSILLAVASAAVRKDDDNPQ